ncbi:MAG: hypothetical protein RDV41_16015 [Planctomycetota bacterium]|nr:hypothetical protein [Planctomycetota bacterium]
MDHLTCDICGNGLLLDAPVRYEVKIEVKAAYDPMELSEDDLRRDFKAEIAALLKKLANRSATEMNDEVYKLIEFDLCMTCQKKYIKNPLPQDNSSHR